MKHISNLVKRYKNWKKILTKFETYEKYKQIYLELTELLGLHTEYLGNQWRAWYQTHDFVFSFLDKEDDVRFEVPRNVMLKSYMEEPRFFDYVDMVGKSKVKIFNTVIPLVGRYKELLEEAKINKANEDFQ